MRREWRQAGLGTESSAHGNETEQDGEYSKRGTRTNKGGCEKEHNKAKQQPRLLEGAGEVMNVTVRH